MIARGWLARLMMQGKTTMRYSSAYCAAHMLSYLIYPRRRSRARIFLDAIVGPFIARVQRVCLPAATLLLSPHDLYLRLCSSLVLRRTLMGTNNNTRSSPPPRKRVRVEAPDSRNSKQEPRLFAPFRALGLITNNVPFVLQTRSHKGATDGPRIHLLTCLGRAWALWEGGKMGLLFVGKYNQRLCT